MQQSRAFQDITSQTQSRGNREVRSDGKRMLIRGFQPAEKKPLSHQTSSFRWDAIFNIEETYSKFVLN